LGQDVDRDLAVAKMFLPIDADLVAIVETEDVR
jgi:hypothetical protein